MILPYVELTSPPFTRNQRGPLFYKYPQVSFSNHTQTHKSHTITNHILSQITHYHKSHTISNQKDLKKKEEKKDIGTHVGQTYVGLATCDSNIFLLFSFVLVFILRRISKARVFRLRGIYDDFLLRGITEHRVLYFFISSLFPR